MIVAGIRCFQVGWLRALLFVSVGLISQFPYTAVAQDGRRVRVETERVILYADDAYTTEFDPESSFPDEVRIVGPHGYWPESWLKPDTEHSVPRYQMLVIPFDLTGMEPLFEGEAYVYFDLASDRAAEPLYVVAYAPARFDLGPNDQEPVRMHAWKWKPVGTNAMLHATHPVRAALEAGATSLEIVIYSDDPLRLSQTDGGPTLVVSDPAMLQTPSDDMSGIHVTEYSTVAGDSCKECVDCRDGPGLCLTMRFCGPTVHCCGSVSTYTLRVFGTNDSSGDLEVDFWEDDLFSDHIYDPPWIPVGPTIDRTFSRTFDVCRFEDGSRAELVGEFELHEGGDNNECGNWHDELLVTLTRGCCEDRDCGSCETCENGACVNLVCTDLCEECDGNHGCEEIDDCCRNNSICPPCERCSGNRCVLVSCGNCQECNGEHGCRDLECCNNSDCPACERCSGNRCVSVPCGNCQQCDGNHGCRNLECCDNSACGPCEVCEANSCMPVNCAGCNVCDNNHGCTNYACCTDANCTSCQSCNTGTHTCVTVVCSSCDECDNNHGCTDYECCSDEECGTLKKCTNHSCVSSCGDQTCDTSRGEDCSSCVEDCGCGPCDQCVNGTCVGNCGNGTCEAGCNEDCNNCVQDCGCPACERCANGSCTTNCGNRTCEPSCGEDCSTCPTDCGCGPCDQCENGTCVGNCGNGSCEANCSEDCNNCPQDCSSTCGDGSCDCDENCNTCPADCDEDCPTPCENEVCGNEVCKSECDEDCSSCAVDCGCGPCDQCVNGVCRGNCGNGSCEPGCEETCENCPVDCDPICGDDVCCDEQSSCPPDCPCAEVNCDDGLFCNGQETCLNGQCLDGPDPCPDNVSCDEADDTCFVTFRINSQPAGSGGFFESYDYQTTAEIGVPNPPEPGMVFVRWTGPGITEDNQSDDLLRLPATENKTITALFQEICIPSPNTCGCGDGVCPAMILLTLGWIHLRFVSPRRRTRRQSRE